MGKGDFAPLLYAAQLSSFIGNGAESLCGCIKVREGELGARSNGDSILFTDFDSDTRCVGVCIYIQTTFLLVHRYRMHTVCEH